MYCIHACVAATDIYTSLLVTALMEGMVSSTVTLYVNIAIRDIHKNILGLWVSCSYVTCIYVYVPDFTLQPLKILSSMDSELVSNATTFATKIPVSSLVLEDII